ncbi:hypothetical protein GJ744_009888 [Endocarpon pusillum]|uniref:Uncharacterized protein n=1 Tax=Endocarpon pusillum TaxID=364733 RepID=A0A8H7AIZ8_9EURO|nr:hypothetical protein GJ744_009888 [Endocarpon pusillum]
MATQWGSVSRQRLMQNVNLLWTLKDVPERPQENELPHIKIDWRQLSIEREKQLVDLLAFLAGTNDDYRKVMAVCVEESSDHDHLTIRLASNTGDNTSVLDGFREMANILERASTRVETKLADYCTLLRCVVRLDEAKLLSRLRSRHARTKYKSTAKRPLLVQLHDTIRNLPIKNTALHSAGLLELEAKSGKMLSAFNALEGIPKQGLESDSSIMLLMKIIEQAEDFHSKLSQSLHRALAASPAEPSLKAYLPIALRKLGRYSSATQELVTLVRNQNYSVFRNISVKTYKVPRPQGPLFLPPFPSLAEAAWRIIQSKIPPQHVSSVPAFLGEEYATKEKAYGARMSANNKCWKVHAEIQLLFYYEINPQSIKPRVIGSSKSACYLCNLFLKLHGVFHVPRTHGKLYGGWILPDWVSGVSKSRGRSLGNVVDQFNEEIEDTIITVLRSPKTRYNPPNESKAPSIAQWSSSTVRVGALPVSIATPAASRSSILSDPHNPRQFSSHTSLPNEALMSPVMSLGCPSADDVSNPSAAKPELDIKEPSDSHDGSSTVIPTRSVRSSSSIHPELSPTLPNDIGAVTTSTAPLDMGVVSEEPVLSNRVMTPGESFSYTFASANDDIFLQVGKLHLTLSRDLQAPPPSDLQHSPEHIIMVKRLDAEAQHGLAASNQLGEVINARGMAPGEAITVDRGGWLSEHDLVISGGPGMAVAVRYSAEGLQN